MKTNIMRVSGGKSSEITLPQQFMEPVRPDLVKRQFHHYKWVEDNLMGLIH